jgi:hypothetical protein
MIYGTYMLSTYVDYAVPVGHLQKDNLWICIMFSSKSLDVAHVNVQTPHQEKYEEIGIELTACILKNGIGYG